MSLSLNVEGINIYLKINNYNPSNIENLYSDWCKCDFMFNSGDWLNYHKENDEIFLCCEVEELEATLTMLLNGELAEDKEISFIEPDFTFYINTTKSDQITEPYWIDWQIHFWHEGLTANYLSVTLDKEDIIMLRDYLSKIIKEKQI